MTPSLRLMKPSVPSSMRPKLLETQSLTNYEGILHWLGWPGAGDQELIGKSYFPYDRTGYYPLDGLKTNWFPLVSSSCECSICWPHPEVQSLLWEPPGTETCCGRRQFSWFVSSIPFAWCSVRADSSTRHAARSHVEGLRIGVNLRKEREKKKKPLNNLSNQSAFHHRSTWSSLDKTLNKTWFVHKYTIPSSWGLTSLYTGGGRKRNSWTKSMRGRSRMPLRSSEGCGDTALFCCSASSSVTTEL